MLSFLFIVSVDCFLLLLGFGVWKYRNGAAAITAVVVVVAAAVASSNGGGYAFFRCVYMLHFQVEECYYKDASTVWRTRECFFGGGFCFSCRLQRAHVS